jgi:HPt (histidine-containing phosphotransfer) domain-containing protein
MADLSRSVHAEDYGHIKILAHTLHSSLGVLGFPQHVLTDMRSIEDLARHEKGIDSISKKAEAIRMACEKARAELLEVLKEL